MTRLSKLALALVAVCAIASPAMANGLGEGRPYQFRTDSQRSVNLTVERSRLELLGLLGGGGVGGGGGGTGQTGNSSSINISGSNNTVTINQTNSGAQTQSRDCSSSSFNITGGMYGC
ncbi:hypothetical protein SAMN06295905_1958 [Devosia lucknowensis]|uniref:Curlin associated repeat-containing protein n=1 Tax=Devosia lucknowensis TaxID=1096929 RepID=A0A1Y6F9Y8_9HYPH|nr:hypothetical protein [Devosia lucknowensis]SMQ71738.1 hypothetical protein SAMN06295905_1958 [Devosia lucknowensis]